MAGKTKTSTKIMIAVGVIAVASFALSQYLNYKVDNFSEDISAEAAETASALRETATGEYDDDNMYGDDVPVEGAQSRPYVEQDLTAMLKPRILGNPNAPLKISEHASLTCSHCAHFHNDVFKDFKAEYIDSGKAYLVFSDFPLNAPALHGSMIARCVPEDRFFDFVGELFENQDTWAYDRQYLGYLKTKAADYGLDDAAFDRCINNTELRDGLTASIKAAQSQWNIQATPSFVINNQVTITGASDLTTFEKKVQDALTEIEAGSAE